MCYTYTSILNREFNDYLNLLLAAGKKNKDEKYILADLDRFLIKHEVFTKTLTEELLIKWFKTMDIKPSTKKRKLFAIRGLIKYLLSLGFKAFIPEIPCTASDYVPYIFSEEEFARIITEVDNLQLQHSALTVQAIAQFPVLIRLLYGCGLRLGEALALQWKDVDLNGGIILIRFAKNEKQRLVPMSSSLTEVCRMYRNSIHFSLGESDYLFGNRHGKPYCQKWIRSLFTTVLENARIEYTRAVIHERGPCLHCLRHLFTLHSFAKSAVEGRTFEDSVPYLSTYLGHTSIMETDKYLRFSYEIYPDAHQKISDYTQNIFPEVISE